MARTSAAMAALVVAAVAAAASSAAPPRGLPGCKTTCGNVSVPYPFGIQPGCYRPGFNLTCDTSRHGSPRLLLGDGTLRVVDIFIQNATMRVLQDGPVVENLTSDGLNITLAPYAGGHYGPSYLVNEFVLFGCNVLATLAVDSRWDSVYRSPHGCASFCPAGSSFTAGDRYCSGEGCCRESFADSIDPSADVPSRTCLPTHVHLRPLESLINSNWDYMPMSVFLAEKGWLDKWGKEIYSTKSFDTLEPKNDIPLFLRWDIMQGLVRSDSEKIGPGEYRCPGGVASLCKSKNSECSLDSEVYMCQCEQGYNGNPYVASGCQDIDECKHPQDNGCFGDCTNTDGSFECRCPSGTFGDAAARGGCLKINSAADVVPLGMTPARIGLPNCDTTCGDVQVPYPFGFGPNRCHLPGFDLTCDEGHNPPRLLLGGNSTLQVVGIFLNDSTVRVIHTSTFDITTYAVEGEYNPGDGLERYALVQQLAGVQFPDIGGPYMLSARNEFILTGCNVEATLLGEYINSTHSIITSCDSTCAEGIIGDPFDEQVVPRHIGNEYCSGRDGCCHAHIPLGSRPEKVKFKRLLNNNGSQESLLPALAFVAEEGQIDQWYMIFNRSASYDFTEGRVNGNVSIDHHHTASQVPLVLQWVLRQEVRTSPQSNCWRENESYTCHCKKGFYGNPYIIDGCQDIDECENVTIRNACFGNCYNLPGYHECRCPRGTHGDPYQLGGCVRSITGLTIGLLVASGPALLLLVLGVSLALCKVKQRRIKLLKQKYFKQNRGQLLQQLVSPRADIAERMIIPLTELEKATNNFDQSRKLGGGGHGTVYKGILSDLHVVAIKKSKVTIQREIDEFINEVAILSQINHRNVVKLLGCCLETQVPLLVYEFISNGTLHSHLHTEDTTRSLPWRDRLRIAGETAKAIDYLHSSVSVPIIHRDIKSANILLDDALTAKVSDFGASRYIIPTDQNEATTTAVQGTIGYLDPMYYYTRRMTEMSDVYSFGVVLVELLTRKVPTSYRSQEGNGLVAQFNALLVEGNVAQILDPQIVAEGGTEVEEAVALAASCIKYRGEERPTMRQLDMALEALQAPNERVLENQASNRSEGNILTNNLPTRRRTNMEQVSRQYSIEEEFLMSASYPR